MKNITNLRKKILTTFILFLSITSVYALDVYCYTTCNPDTGYGYVGDVTIHPLCDASSPSSYNWTLTVNGVTISGSQACPAPNATINFSFLMNSINDLFAETVFAGVFK